MESQSPNSVAVSVVNTGTCNLAPSGKPHSWIFDSGASQHMTHNSSILVNCSSPLSPTSIQTADGSPMEVLLYGEPFMGLSSKWILVN